ncbi:MAG: ECF transporter S component [Ruminococcus sp.]|nr:ECF transporter S component [Ruminococcus sp.]
MTKTNTKTNMFRMAGLGILTAIIIVLQVVTTYFPTKPFAITLALIPIVIGAALYGARAGAYLGGVFSVVVIAMCIFGVDVGGAMVWNANPFLCVVVCLLKGVAAGFVSGLVFKALSKKNTIVATAAAAVLSPIVNTGIFSIGMLLFFKPVLEAWSGGSDVLYYVVFTMTGVNFLVELGVNIVVTPIIVSIIKAVRKGNLS